MWRAIFGVILGYVTMGLLVFLTFTIAYLAMGTERAFQPGTYDVTALWLVVSFALSLLAAAAGGYVCALIAKNARATFALAGLVVVLGLLFAVPVLMNAGGEQPARSEQVGNLDAMQRAQQPAWVALLNPLVGAAGVLLGGRRKNERASERRFRTA